MEDRPKKILIVGGSGYLGRHLMHKLGPDRVVATAHLHGGGAFTTFNAATQDLGDVIPDLAAFSHAILLLGQGRMDACHADPVGTRALNVDAILRMAEALSVAGVIPVFTSSDAVFDGMHGPSDESAIPCPSLVYGKHKRAVEKAFATSGWPSIVLRLAKVYGDTPGDGTMFTSWAKTLRQGGQLCCATDSRFSPVFIDDVAAAILTLIGTGATGLFNCGGPKHGSHHHWSSLLLRELERTGPVPGHIQSCMLHDLPVADPRPLDTSMTSHRLTETCNCAFTAPETVFRRIAAQV